MPLLPPLLYRRWKINHFPNVRLSSLIKRRFFEGISLAKKSFEKFHKARKNLGVKYFNFQNIKILCCNLQRTFLGQIYSHPFLRPQFYDKTSNNILKATFVSMISQGSFLTTKSLLMCVMELLARVHEILHKIQHHNKKL